MFDFAKNTHQCGLTFKFDALDVGTIRAIVDHLYLGKRLFETVGKVEGGSNVALTRGDGSEKAPYYQLRFAANEIVLWTGWYVSYREWRAWRDNILDEIGAPLKVIQSELIGSMSSQALVVLPTDRLKEPSDVSELKPILELFRRFVPPELSSTGNSYCVFGDAAGNHSLELWAGANPLANESNITFTSRLNTSDPKIGVAENFINSCRRSDELLEKAHSGLLGLLLKS